MKYAVLTGDIIKSRSLIDSLNKVQDLLKSIPEMFNERYEGCVEPYMSIFRGDSWQLLLHKKELAIRLALFIKTVLAAEHNVRTRISIGIGSVDRIDAANISQSSGAAFELSGKGLDELEKHQELHLVAEDHDLQYQIRLLDCVIKKVTPRQALALKFALLGLTQEKIAEQIDLQSPNKKVTQQAVAKLLKNCCWKIISEYLDYFEQLICKE